MESVQSLSVDVVQNGNQPSTVLSILSSRKLQIIHLPSYSGWKGQHVSGDVATAVSLGGNQYRSFGEGICLSRLCSTKETVSIGCRIHYAVFCQPRKEDIIVSTSFNEDSKDESLVRTKSRQFTSSPGNALASPSQPFDEPTIRHTPLGTRRKIEVICDQHNEKEASIVTPTGELDSKGSLKTAALEGSFESAGSMLKGLDFLPSDPGFLSPPVAKRLLLPPKSNRTSHTITKQTAVNIEPSADQLAHLVVVSIELSTATTSSPQPFAIKTLHAPLPPQMSYAEGISFKFVPSSAFLEPKSPLNLSASELMFSPSPAKSLTPSIEPLEPSSSSSQILVAIKPTASQNVLLRGFSLLDHALVPNELNVSVDLLQNERERLFKTSIKTLSLDCFSTTDASQLNLRVFFAVASSDASNSDSKKSPIGISLVEESGIAVGIYQIPLLERLRQPFTPKSDSKVGDSAEAKLDAILAAFRGFESSVNRRLDEMQETMEENSKRLQRMEDALVQLKYTGLVNEI